MAREDFRFAFTKRVWYPDIDSQGIVYFPRYLEYVDIGLTEYLRALGTPVSTLEGETPPEYHTVNCAISYRAPMLLDELIDIHVRTARIGRSSVLFCMELHGHARDNLRASVEHTCVFVAQARGRPRPLDEAMVARFETFEGRTLRAENQTQNGR